MKSQGVVRVESTATSCCDSAMQVLVVRDLKELKNLKQQDFLKFHVVLASTAIQASQGYADHIKLASRNAQTSRFGSTLMSQKVLALRDRVRSASKTPASFNKLLGKSPAILELMWWRRVILDEFHESEACPMHSKHS